MTKQEAIIELSALKKRETRLRAIIQSSSEESEDVYFRHHNRNSLIYHIMKTGIPCTLSELSCNIGYSSASISAGIREFRRKEFGENIVHKMYKDGRWEYTLIENENGILKQKYT